MIVKETNRVEQDRLRTELTTRLAAQVCVGGIDEKPSTPDAALRRVLEALKRGAGSDFLRSIYVPDRDRPARSGDIAEADRVAVTTHVMTAYGAMLDSGSLDKSRFLTELRRQDWSNVSFPNAPSVLAERLDGLKDWQSPKEFFDPSTCNAVAGFFYVVRGQEVNCQSAFPRMIQAEHESLQLLVRQYTESTAIPPVRYNGNSKATIAWPEYELGFDLERAGDRWLVHESYSFIRKCFPGGKWQAKWIFMKGDPTPFPDDLDFGDCAYDPKPLSTPTGPRTLVYHKPPGVPAAYWGRYGGMDAWPGPEFADYIVGYSSPFLSKRGHWVVFLSSTIQYVPRERFLELYRQRRARPSEKLPEDPFVWWQGR